MSRSVGSRTCWHEFWLRFGQALGPSGLNASTRPWKPRTLSQEGAVTAPFQIAIGRDPELPGDLLQDLANVISSSSILHDDVAAHTTHIASYARMAVMQFNDNLATRRALDQRPRPLREFSVGDEVAVWRRGTGKGAPGKQRRAQFRGPGIILGAVRGNYFVAMPRERHQSRLRTAEAQNG